MCALAAPQYLHWFSVSHHLQVHKGSNLTTGTGCPSSRWCSLPCCPCWARQRPRSGRGSNKMAGPRISVSLFHAAVKLAGAVVLDGMATTFVLDCSAVRGLHDSALCPRVRVRSSEHFSFLHRDGNNSSGLSRVATYVSIYNAGTCMHLTMHRPTETPDCPHLLPQQHAGSYPAIKFQASTTKCASQSALRVEQSIRTPECDRSGNWRLTQGIEAVMERVRHLLLSSDVFASTAGPAKNFTLKGLQIG